LLLDSGSDLNVYNRGRDEGNSSNCCGEGVEHACCEKTPNCCSDTDQAPESSSMPINSELEDVDYNELAGMQ
jgi:hypothetical protein